MDTKTYDDYMKALKDLYIIEDLEAWNPNIRSKTSIRSTPTRHFVDTSIAVKHYRDNAGLECDAVGGAYKREDGVFVAPINLLRP